MRVLRNTAVLAIPLFFAAGAAQATDTKEVHKTVPLEKDGRVSVETYKGSLTVTTWDRPEVRIDARIEPDGTESDQKEKVALTEVRVSGSGGSVTIRSDYEGVKHRHLFGLLGWDEGTLPFVRYNIQVPATARIEIKDHKSDIKVSNLKADLKLHTYKGTAAVVGLDGEARVETYKGDVRVEFARFSRASRFETHKGEIEVRLPKDSRFELDAGCGRRGDIQTDFALATHAGRSLHSRLSGAVNGGGPQLKLSTYKGTLRVRAT